MGEKGMVKVARLADYRSKNSTHNSEDWLAAFKEHLESEERSDNTISSYLSDLESFIKWFEKTQGSLFHPRLVTALDLRDYKRLLTQKYKPGSVNRKLSTLSVFLGWAKEMKCIETLPKIPKQVKEQRQGIRWLSRTEQNALLRRVERYGSARDVGTVKLLLNTGLRVTELTELLWTDVEISDRKGELVVRSGKGSKRRLVPLNKEARQALLLLGYEENQGIDKPVTIGQRGQMTRRGIQNVLEKYRGDIDNLSCHSLRHTFCKNLVDAGVSLEKVAALAGHDSLETTRRYCEPSPHDLALAVELIGEDE
jgi:integrase/recombinase XerC